MKKVILVVEDDPELGQLLQDYFRDWGYRVLVAGDGSQMREQLKINQVDLVILDLMLPNEDGLALCRVLQATSNIPVLMLATSGDDMNRIIGLEMGADDYLNKPFNPRELLARVKNILRRTHEADRALTRARELHFSGWILDLDAHHLRDNAGVVIWIPSGEFRLLKALAEKPNRVLSRNLLIDIMSNREGIPFDRTVDVMISRLRRRLGTYGGEPLIKTIRNEGYMLVSERECRQ
jgi:two-component system OmpR family response regulator